MVSLITTTLWVPHVLLIIHSLYDLCAEGRGENAVGAENIACFCNTFFGYQSLHNWQYLLWIEVTLLIVIWVYSKLFINIALIENDSTFSKL